MLKFKRTVFVSALGVCLVGVGLAPAEAYCGDTICVYKHANFGEGNPVEGFNYADSNLNNGNHFSDGSPTNDAISSINSYSNDTIRFYTSSAFRGNYQDIPPDGYDELVLYNDQYSSFRPLI